MWYVSGILILLICTPVKAEWTDYSGTMSYNWSTGGFTGALTDTVTYNGLSASLTGTVSQFTGTHRIGKRYIETCSGSNCPTVPASKYFVGVTGFLTEEEPSLASSVQSVPRQ